MSHSTVLVVVREADTIEAAVQEAIEALAPFNEELSVPEYTRWENEESVKEAVEHFSENLDPAVGPRPNPSDEQAMTEWTRRAVGDWACGDAYRGVHEDGRYGYRSTFNPRARWDWYSLGGRWRGFFQVREGVKVGYEGERGPISFAGITLPAPQDNAKGQVEAVTKETTALLGETGSFGDAEGTNLLGRADFARKGDIDFEAMRTLAGMQADAAYDEFERVTKDISVPPTWDQVRENNGATDPEAEGFREAIESARREFGDYEWVKALREARLAPFFGDIHEHWCVGAGGREEFVQQACENITATFAVLLDGEWHERGKMGWWGMVSDAQDAGAWSTKQAELIDSLPDDAWLAVYDVHI